MYCLSYLVLSVVASKSKSKLKAKHLEGESEARYRRCVPPCKLYMSAGDTHTLCVVCLGARHAESALEGAECPHCELFPLSLLRSRKALFDERGAFTSAPRSAGPAAAEVERRRRSWGSQLDLMERLETSESLSPSSTIRSYCRSPRMEARSADTSPRAVGSALLPSSSEGVDVESFNDVPSHSPQYEELVNVVTRAMAKLSINWPAQCHVEPQRGKLDERFLRFKTPPPHRSLPFFPHRGVEIMGETIFGPSLRPLVRLLW